MPVLTYGSEILLWKEKEGSIIMCEQMNNLKDLLSIKRIDRMPNAWVTYLCGVNEGVDKRIKETDGVKRIWASRLKGAPQREGSGSEDSEEGRSVT